MQSAVKSDAMAQMNSSKAFMQPEAIKRALC